MAVSRKKKTADKVEILQFLTAVMRNEELSEKDRMGAAIKLGSYLGLDEKSAESDELPRVIIYDGIQKDQLS